MEKNMSFLRKIFFYVVCMNMTYSLFSNLDFASRDSRFVVSGGSLNIVSPLQNWTGTLQLVSGSITGNSIVLNEGQVRTTKGVLETTGQVTPSATPIVTLRTNEKVIGSAGVLIDSLNVRGTGNILAGQPDFVGTSTLLNSLAELQINITNRLNQSILMNNGKITLLNDLQLGDNTTLTGSGRVDLNYRTLRMPAKETTWTSRLYFMQANDVVLNAKTSLSGTWTFEGVGAVLQGNGNILDLTAGGTLWIKSGADVEFTDIHVRGLGNIYGSIVFEDATSRIRLSNATLQLASNYSVTQGGIYVEGVNSSIITGTSTLTLATGASMTVDRVTLFADALDVTATVNISPNIPDGLKLVYKNNGILKAAGGGDSSLAIANSNAIVGWIKNTSNVMVSTYNLVVQNSFAIINNSNQITANSQAIKSMSQGITNNSNAIVGWVKNTSTAMAGFVVDMSNAIVSSGGNALAVDNSNAIIGWIKNTSNAVAGLMVDMSNAIVSAGGNALAVDNSNAIIGWIKNTSNAVAGLMVDMSNAIVSAGGNALAVDNSNAIIGWIKNTSNAVAGFLVTVSNGVSTDHTLLVNTSNAVNGLLVMTSNAVVSIYQLVVDSSQAIVGWIKDTSNSVSTGGNQLAIDNSNAIIGWLKDTSNTVAGLLVAVSNGVSADHTLLVNTSNAVNGLLVTTSNAVVAMHQLAVDSSQAIVGWIKDTSNSVSTGGNQLAIDNSNAIIGWLKDTSNTVAGLLVAVSNGVSADHTLLINTSNAVNGLLVAVSNGVSVDHTLLVNTSNAVSGLLVATSNAVVASGGNALAVDNSNAIVGWIKDTSNSLVSGGGSVDNSAALGTIDHGPAHIHMASAMTMSYNVYISADHSFYIHSSGLINGAGHRINFATNVTSMMFLDTGVTVTFENVELFDYSDDKVSFGVGSDIIFGTGCRVHLNNLNFISRIWRCAGTPEIYGGGNEVIIFDDASGIEVSPSSQVLIHDVRLSGVEGTRLYCLSNKSSIEFDNAQIILSNDYTFTMGSMKFYRDVTWAGTTQWHYASAMGSTIDSQARLIFDRGLSWFYDPSIVNKYGIIFTDSSAQWLLNGNELTISPTGIQLTKGHWVIDDENVLVGQGTTLSEAIILGNGVSDDDFDLELLPAATITLTSGVIDYQNIA
jgi:hypothetical protein